MNKKSSASTSYSINWVGTTIFVIACLGLLGLLGYLENGWLYLQSSLSVFWKAQSIVTQQMKTSWHAMLFGVPLIIFISIVLLEHFRPWRKLQKRFRKGFWVDVLYTLLAFGLFKVLGGVAAQALILVPFEHALSFLNLSYPLVYVIDEVPTWARIILLVILSEFVGYWAHRLQHNVNFLWHIHKIHHSSVELDVMNALRLHWLELLWLNLFGYVTLGIIGFNVIEIGIVTTFTTFLCYFTHANVYVPIGKLKYIINSPQMHIWHHSIDIDPNRNVNYGGALSIWDWIYGTAYFTDERPENVRLGFKDVESFPTTFHGQFIYPFAVFGRKLLRIFVVPTEVRKDETDKPSDQGVVS